MVQQLGEDEGVHKELDDRLVRAATTTSSLEAERDSEYSGDEESLVEDASKQESRINAIDTDEDITLVSATNNKMFDIDVLGGEEVFFVGQNENIVEEVVGVAQVSTTATTVTITTKEITLAQDKGKEIMIEEPVKPKKKDQIKLDEEAAKTERLQAHEQEELSDAVKATLFQKLLEKSRNHFAAKKSRIEKEQTTNISSTEKDNIAFRRVNTFEDFRIELVEGKEKREGEELVQEITKKQKVEDEKKG
uniref:Uncharacterized protein n=1 Tax=Tanacetum cinerariifolium TaxID=118510 RepID=A0A6L2MJ62_TANCI|nr:hypothetical protein [Tanacetum cinerariifolium]